MECCLVWSCCLCCLFPSLHSIRWFHKSWPPSTSKKEAQFDTLGFFCVHTHYYPGPVFYLQRVCYDKKASCLWKPRTSHNVALLLNTVAVSQSPWHRVVSVYWGRLWGRISFSLELKTESVLFWVSLRSTRSRSRRGILRGFSSPARHTSAWACCTQRSAGDPVLFPSTLGGQGVICCYGSSNPVSSSVLAPAASDLSMPD